MVEYFTEVLFTFMRAGIVLLIVNNVKEQWPPLIVLSMLLTKIIRVNSIACRKSKGEAGNIEKVQLHGA